jgi:hypothetical protein
MIHPDAMIVRWRPARGPPRRLHFRPRDGGYWRCEEVWTGCGWRETGREPIHDMAVEGPPDSIASGLG